MSMKGIAALILVSARPLHEAPGSGQARQAGPSLRPELAIVPNLSQSPQG